MNLTEQLGSLFEQSGRTVKAYKLFRIKNGNRSKLYPLFVNANKPVPIGKWVKAETGQATSTGKVKSKIGSLAFRPGWHSGNFPVATHIGGKSKKGIVKPDFRPDEQVWAEILVKDDVAWQEVANSRARKSKAGKIIPRTAQITDQIPFGGFYRYKTNPNMFGEWLISGEMKVVRVLSDEEVEKVNAKFGVRDLPRLNTLQRVVEDAAFPPADIASSRFRKEKERKMVKPFKTKVETLTQELVEILGDVSQLEEGVFDPSIFKAIFLAGSGGSGKGFVGGRTTSGLGFKVVNQDDLFEFFMRKQGLDFRMPDSEKEQRDLLRAKAKEMTHRSLHRLIQGRLGLILDGTARDASRIKREKKWLESLGYDCAMIMVSVDLETALSRNEKRAEEGGRRVPPEVLESAWKQVQLAKPKYEGMFGQNYFEVDNSGEGGDVKTLGLIWKEVRKFSTKPLSNPKAVEWVNRELNARRRD
tara:strand:+ start:2898 stop:4313 length:1416 start_codon:yes stop_codon:yes gene_type:complete